MVSKNEARLRRQARQEVKPGHNPIKLRDNQTLFIWHIDDPTKMAAISVPAGLLSTQFVISKTEGVRWKVGAPPVDGVDF